MKKIIVNEANGKVNKVVRYGKRYGYWWKKHKKVYAGIKDYNEAVDYTGHLYYQLDAPISKKHIMIWLKVCTKLTQHKKHNFLKWC